MLRVKHIYLPRRTFKKINSSKDAKTQRTALADANLFHADLGEKTRRFFVSPRVNQRYFSFLIRVKKK
jgi:hypothetical protein